MLLLKGSGIQGARWGAQVFLVDTDLCLFFGYEVCAKLDICANTEILLQPENLIGGFGWCRGFLMLLLYIKMNFTIEMLSLSKFVSAALCIDNKYME